MADHTDPDCFMDLALLDDPAERGFAYLPHHVFRALKELYLAFTSVRQTLGAPA